MKKQILCKTGKQIMRKGGSLFLILMLMIFSVGCSKPKPQEDVDNDRQLNEEVEPDDGLVTVWLLEKEINPNRDDEVCNVYKYNEDGLLVEKTDGSAKKEHRYTFSYNDKGDMTAETYYIGDKKEDETTYEHKYDEQGLLVETVITEYKTKDDGNTTISEKSRNFFTYDEANNLIKIRHEYIDSHTGESEDPYFETKYDYDENKMCIKREHFVNKQSSSKTIYTYDENRNLVLKQTIEANDFYINTTYEYDSDGNMVKEIQDINGNTKKEFEYSYDRYGNRVSDNSLEYEYLKMRVTPEQKELIQKEKLYEKW